MASILIFIGDFLVWFAVTAWALALAARMVGSSRGRLRYGVVATVLNVAISIVFGVTNTVLSGLAKDVRHALALGIGVVLAEFYVIFLLFQWTFKLPVKRTLAPFAVLIAMTGLQVAFALAVLRPFVFEAFVIPTPSMAPTINVGDRFTVNKLLRPRRWDLVAYWNESSELPQKSIYCKRAIGLPSERLRFENGNLYVNDQPVTAPPVLAGRLHASPAQTPWSGQRYHDGETFVLGPDEYFFIGDNVDISLDSRLLGPSRASSLVGVTDFMYWPPRKACIFR